MSLDDHRPGALETGLGHVRERVTVEQVFVGLIVAVWAGLYLHGLGDHALRVWDESRYATPARLMVEYGDWLDPVIRVNTHTTDLGLTPRLTKPPLVYWMQATAMTALGITATVARLPSALAALGCAVVVYGIGRDRYDARAGLAGGLLLLGFPGVLLGSHGGIAAVSDTTLALFGSLFVWHTWRGRNSPRLLALAGVWAGLAVMTKGIAAGVFVVIVVPFVGWYYRSYLTRWTLAGVASALVVALPWHLYAWLTHGHAFIHQYFGVSVGSRVAGQLTAPEVEPVFGFMNYPYLKYAVQVFVPPYPYALPLFGLGIVCALVLVGWLSRRDGYESHRGKLLLVWWAVAVPLTFALAGGNHAWYLLPMYVPGAVLVGFVPAAIADGTFVSALYGLSGRTRGPTHPGDSGRLRFREWVGKLVTRHDVDSAPLRTAVYVVACLCLVGLLVASSAPPPTEPYNAEQRAMGQTVAATLDADQPVHVWLGDHVSRRALMSFSFYADRPLERTSLDGLQHGGAGEYAIVPLDQRRRLHRNYRTIARGPENGIAVVELVGQPASVATLASRRRGASYSPNLVGTTS